LVEDLTPCHFSWYLYTFQINSNVGLYCPTKNIHCKHQYNQNKPDKPK
jgi:hypothetical protein